MEQQNGRNINKELPFLGFSHVCYRHSTGFLYTPSVKYVAQKYICYWFIDIIMKGGRNLDIEGRCPLYWKLKRLSGLKFRITCHDWQEKLIWQREIHSSFVGDEVSFVFTDECWDHHGGMLTISKYDE
ncbi:hypothetical protein LX64_05190 [Chitinophaga skermanii]|uniref:DUF6876 domain-containing protein n=1 Tax=Chitinophaga skermanii TaxID=331697 RepID=A0A327PXF3_9BACT|nr:DUF6876 family protein [Chitinophaga skermanii]RAI96990.1 hypothetical protein LX64_05190 [Chitinophaga skermanii]